MAAPPPPFDISGEGNAVSGPIIPHQHLPTPRWRCVWLSLAVTSAVLADAAAQPYLDDSDRVRLASPYSVHNYRQPIAACPPSQGPLCPRSGDRQKEYHNRRLILHWRPNCTPTVSESEVNINTTQQQAVPEPYHKRLEVAPAMRATSCIARPRAPSAGS